MSFLMGLNESYSQIRGQLLLFDPIPSINQIFSLILQEEMQRAVSSGSSSDFNKLPMAVKQISKKKSQDSSRVTTQKKDCPIYSHCGMLGHTVGKCFKLHGYPLGFKPKFKATINVVISFAGDSSTVPSGANTPLSTAQYQQLLSFLANQSSLVTKPTLENCSSLPENSSYVLFSYNFSSNLASSWIIDLGASSHICCYHKYFTTFKPLSDFHVALPTSDKISIAGIGFVFPLS